MTVIDEHLIPSSSSAESTVFYYKMMTGILTSTEDIDLATGCSVFHAIMILLVLLILHFANWRTPHEQKRILVLIFLPSILSTTSYLAMQISDDSKTLFLLLDSIKECSVGLGLAMFLSLVQAYLNINTNTLSREDIRQKIGKRVIGNVFPVTLFQPQYAVLELDNLNLYKCWTWQFLVIRLVCSVLMIVLQLLDIYPTWLMWAFFFITNISVFFACYSVLAFFQAFVQDLELQMSPIKFTCVQAISYSVKGIVFICFFQGGVLKVLTAMGLIKSNSFLPQELQNYLVCLEMYIITTIQYHGYSHLPYTSSLDDPPIHRPKAD